MGDNIRNFDDYKKKVSSDEQFTEDIDIQIQDPLDFLSASEREEYYKSQRESHRNDYYDDEPVARPAYEEDYRGEEVYESSDDYDRDDEFYEDDGYYQDDEDEYDALDEDAVYEREVRAKKNYIRKSAKKEAQRQARQKADDRRAAKKAEEKKKKARHEAEVKKAHKKEEEKKRARREADDRKLAKEKKAMARKEQEKAVKSRRDYVEDDYYEDESGFNPYLVVRVASIITGVLILVMIGMIFKKKVFDSVVIPDPDSETNVSVGEIAGYTATNDIIVTTADLNLRNRPSTTSDESIVVQVPAGTELSRKYVKDDGEWAQVEYEGQTLYCVMKYAKVKE